MLMACAWNVPSPLMPTWSWRRTSYLRTYPASFSGEWSLGSTTIEGIVIHEGSAKKIKQACFQCTIIQSTCFCCVQFYLLFFLLPSLVHAIYALFWFLFCSEHHDHEKKEAGSHNMRGFWRRSTPENERGTGEKRERQRQREGWIGRAGSRKSRRGEQFTHLPNVLWLFIGGSSDSLRSL